MEVSEPVLNVNEGEQTGCVLWSESSPLVAMLRFR